MTFQNLNGGPIVRTIATIFILGIVVIFALQFIFVMGRMMDTITSIDPDMPQDEQEKRIQEEVDNIFNEAQNGSPALERTAMIQWALIALITFFGARRAAARNAASLEQGTGYGVVIGAGTIILFLLCICTSTVNPGIQVIFLGIILASGVLGGRYGGQNPRPQPQASPAPGTMPAHDPLSRFGDSQSGPAGALPPGSRPDTYYNMGVQAALSGRREEARQHFTRVLQMQPRSIAAWLQLANLADTPEQAWNYVQQARSINASDPAVVHAVEVIWPKVAASMSQTPTQNPPPRVQPPYTGGAQDDPNIPRTTLPKASDPEPPTDDFWHSDDDSAGNNSPLT